jgi:hypothetical protein
LYDFELDSTIRPFERFEMGTELFTSLDKEHDIVDRDWRPFVEECDLMQGAQVFTTLDDAWGGFAASYLEGLRDEYPKSCIWVWGIQNSLVGVPREKRQLRLSNIAQSLQQAYTQASMVVPLAVPESQLPPQLDLDCASPWHVSSLLAAVSESALIPSRLKGLNGASLADMAESLNISGNQTLAQAMMSVPPDTDYRVDGGDDLSFFQIGRDESRAMPRRERIFGQITCCRGPGTDQTERDAVNDARTRQIIGNSVIRKYWPPQFPVMMLSGTNPDMSLSYSTTLEFPLLDSYPHIYKGILDGDSTPIRTVLRTDHSVSTRMKNLRSQVTRLIALDERETLSSGLADIADAYQHDWSSGSDEDDDDL